MDIILKYFADLTPLQKDQIGALSSLYHTWNAKINVVSRKDIDHLYTHHVLHSMVIAKWIKFVPGTKILDVGCGGGFPGIPLAILFPQVEFHLIDSIKKKLSVVQDVADHLNLKNIKTTHIRAEEVKSKYDFVISRAVASLPKLMQWTRKNISKAHKNPFPNGLIVLKGGDLRDELKPLQKREYIECTSISTYYEEPYFKEKYIIYVQG